MLKEIARGNVPEFLRSLKAVRLQTRSAQGDVREAICFVTPDYLAVGNDHDFFRLPMTPQTAQAIADAADASLTTANFPTRFIGKPS